MSQALRWTRSQNGIIAGVCRGIADDFQIEVFWVRLAWILSVAFGGFGLGVYVALALALPRKDRAHKAYDPVIVGVCAQLARRLDIEPGLLRFLALILVPFAGSSIVAYFVLYFLLPGEDAHRSERVVGR